MNCLNDLHVCGWAFTSVLPVLDTDDVKQNYETIPNSRLSMTVT